MQTSDLNLSRDYTSTLLSLQQALDPVLVVTLLSAFSHVYDVPFTTPYVLLAALTFLLTSSTLNLVGVYQANSMIVKRVYRIVWGWSIELFVLLLLGYLTKTSVYFSAQLFIAWALTVPIVLLLFHVNLQRLYQFQAGQNVRTAVIAGVTESGLGLAEKIRQSPDLGIKLLGFFNEETQERSQRIAPVLGSLKGLPEYVRRQGVDIVYLALSMKHEDGITALVKELQDTTACVYFVPSVVMYSMMPRTHEINGIPLIAAWTTPFSGMQSVLKRGIDIVFASLAIVCLAPLMLVIAIAVKLSSPGPILFKQRRYGLNGQEIIVYKFRSMTVMEDGNTITQATRNDNRVTQVGAFLRRTSLDELPQFLNVLQGRMSIVGPRPHAILHNEQYRKLISGYMLRHKVKPGITGLAQVHGFRGETDTLEKMQKRVEYDLQYIKNWSLGLDLTIICKTALVFLQDRNAY
jgi:putative colanic acid biosynthesis UDP-glucose lipid carrier transferase